MPECDRSPCPRRNRLQGGAPEASATDTAMNVDLDRLIAPIPGAAAAGVSLLFERTYQQIAEARREDDAALPQGDWERPLKRADWNLVEQLCTDALANRSKDIQIAAWLAEAWLHLKGLEGLTDGLGLIGSLCTEYWDSIHPQVEEGEIEYRVAPFVWINDNISLALRLNVPIAERAPESGASSLTLADWEEALRLENLVRKDAAVAKIAERDRKITRAAFMTSVSLTSPKFFAGILKQHARCASAVAGLEQCIQDKLGDDSPGVGKVREVLEGMRKAVREFGGEPPAAEVKIESKRKAKRGAGSEPPPAQATTQGTDMAENRSTDDITTSGEGLIGSREEAYRRLADAADYLLRTEPHSPCPYLVMRAVAWGKMPLTELLQELVQGESDLRQLYALLGMRPGQ